MKKIGIDMLAVPAKMAGTGFYTLNLLRELVSLDTSFEYEIYLNEELVPQFQFEQDNVTLVPFKIKNLLHRIYIEQFILPKYTKSLELLHAVANVAPIWSKSPVISTIHDVYQIYYPERFSKLKNLYLKLFIPATIKKSETVITVSECTKQDLNKHFPKQAKGTPISVTYEASRYDEVICRGRENFLLFVGTLEPGKNLKTLLLAYATLEIALKEKYPLKIIGGRGWKNSDIAPLIQEHKLENFVEFVGYISDDELQAYYQKATCFILPSLYEGFGLPVLEAMSQGCPVITSNVSSLPEVGGDAAILIEPMSISEIASAIKKIVSDTEFAKSMSDNGYAQNRKFSWKRCAEETLDAYKKILNND